MLNSSHLDPKIVSNWRSLFGLANITVEIIKHFHISVDQENRHGFINEIVEAFRLISWVHWISAEKPIAIPVELSEKIYFHENLLGMAKAIRLIYTSCLYHSNDIAALPFIEKASEHKHPEKLIAAFIAFKRKGNIIDPVKLYLAFNFLGQTEDPIFTEKSVYFLNSYRLDTPGNRARIQYIDAYVGSENIYRAIIAIYKKNNGLTQETLEAGLKAICKKPLAASYLVLCSLYSDGYLGSKSNTPPNTERFFKIAKNLFTGVNGEKGNPDTQQALVNRLVGCPEERIPSYDVNCQLSRMYRMGD